MFLKGLQKQTKKRKEEQRGLYRSDKNPGGGMKVNEGWETQSPD